MLAQPPVVVGTDGSAEGDLAVRVGAFEARRRGVDLHLVHAAQSHVLGGRRPNVSLGHAVALARAVTDDRVAVHALPRTGPADGVLLEASRDAELVVVGAHARGVMAEIVLGSVSWALIERINTPLVFVHTEGDALSDRAPVVFGATDTDADDPVRAFAVAEAELRGVPLVVADAGHPSALVDAAVGAGLLVIGHRQTSRYDAHQAADRWTLRHAPCPVAMVPTQR